MAGKGRPGPDPLPREHGTTRGYDQHRHNDEDPCPPCALAESKARRGRYERQCERWAAARAAAQRAGGAS